VAFGAPVLPIVLSVGMFLFWAALGRALLIALSPRSEARFAWLLAPAIGVAATVVIVFVLNRAGAPIITFARPTVALLVLGAACCLVWTKAVFELKQLGAFVLVLVLAISLVARPMTEFGFDWLGYANDDMANYVLAAQRLVENGFFTPPVAADVLEGRDYSGLYWGLLLRERPGGELIAGWAVAVSGLTGHQVFMPLMVALHLVLISATGALVYRSGSWWAVIVTGVLMSTSPLNTLGMVYQLISQVGGLGLLAAVAALLFRFDIPAGKYAVPRLAILIGLVLSALLIFYVELTPFLGLGFAAFFGAGLLRRHIPSRAVVGSLAIAAVVGALVLRNYLAVGLEFLRFQATSGTSQRDLAFSVFPFYLMPGGLAALWGFSPLAPLVFEPVLSVGIALGGALLFLAVVAALRLALNLQPVGAIAVPMLLIGAYLFVGRNDFGLFKLAMFVQPFFLASLVLLLREKGPRGAWGTLPVALLALGMLPTQWYYIERSRGFFDEVGAAFAEIPYGSATGIDREFVNLLASRPVGPLLLDTPGTVLAKHQALYTKPREASFATRNLFANIDAYLEDQSPALDLFDRSTWQEANSLAQLINDRWVRAEFQILRSDGPLSNGFEQDARPRAIVTREGEAGVVVSTARQSLFNRRRFGYDASGNFALLPYGSISNHLVFVDSERGRWYFTDKPQDIAYFQLERDLIFPEQTMAGLGRYLLFEVLNPGESTRLVLNLTETFAADRAARLPPAAGVGTQRAEFPLTGRGSARVVSPPLVPQQIGGRSYVGVEMGVEGVRFPFNRTGLMNLYGLDLRPDYRLLVGFARDISAISNEEYSSFQPPSAVTRLPADLLNRDLEYSGLYEDGWVSDTAWFGLAQPSDAHELFVKGSVPLVGDAGFVSKMQILVDGSAVAAAEVAVGEFELRFPARLAPGRHRVELAFSDLQPLPNGDKRLVSVLLRGVGFE
jgi:hypothetical protein